MGKRSPKLLFSDEERQDAKLKKTIRKADRAAEKLEKAEENLPKKRVVKKEQVQNPKTGKVTTKFYFEGMDKKKPSSYLSTEVKRAPVTYAAGAAASALRENEDDSAATSAVHSAQKTTEAGVRTTGFAERESKLKPYKKVEKAERQADRANVKALNQSAKQTARAEGVHSNPYSKWQQKRAIKNEYSKAKREKETTKKASEITKKASEEAAKTGKKITEFVAEHPKIFLVISLLASFLIIVSTMLSSCSVMFQGASSAIVSTTYPSLDADMLGAEEKYKGLEAELQNTISNYESTHSYDEYIYELDAIEHDPYVLISLLTAMKQGAWTVGDVESDLSMLFGRQYALSESVQVEQRTRTVTQSDGTTTQETYNYYICTVTLINNNLSHIPSEVLSEDGLKLYAAYMQVLGNRPDLFGDSVYVDKYINTEYARYEIPPEALSDAKFAAMIKEAEKYLGYPYVWGGASPSTSFDCSGFVSWVVNHSGWNFGRLTAEGLRQKCTRVSPANAKPGDLIFFEKTYKTTGASHVGIYVGNGMMIHCGDPIQYASVNSNYFKSHFLMYGRLP